MRPVARLLGAGLILTASAANACFLERGLGGELTTTDPLSIPVLVATRAAAERGLVRSLDIRDTHQLSTALAVLGYVPMRLDGEPLDAPPLRFAVLQAQSGYWTRYVIASGTVRAEPHLAGSGDVDAVLVVSDAALLEAVIANRPLSGLAAAGLVRARGESGVQALATYGRLLDRFAETRLAEQIRQQPPRF